MLWNIMAVNIWGILKSDMNVSLHHLYNRASTAAYQLPGLRSLFYIIHLCVNTDKLCIFLTVPKRSTINTFSLFTAFKGNLILFSFIRKKKNELHTSRIHQSTVITVLSPEAREIKTIPSSLNASSTPSSPPTLEASSNTLQTTSCLFKSCMTSSFASDL